MAAVTRIGGGRRFQRADRAAFELRSATTVSSTSMACSAVTALAETRPTGPSSHSSRSPCGCPGSSARRRRRAPRSRASAIAVVLRRAEPLHPRRYQQWPSEASSVHGVVKPDQIRLHVVLEKHAEPHTCGVGRLNQCIGPLDRDVNRAFRPARAGRVGTRRCPARHAGRGAAHSYQVHRRVREERFEVGVGRGAVGAARRSAWQLPPWTATIEAPAIVGRARMRVADVARAEDADVHVAILPPANRQSAIVNRKSCNLQSDPPPCASHTLVRCRLRRSPSSFTA